MVRLITLFMISTLFPATAFAWFWGPKSYDECIIEESRRFESTPPAGVLTSIGRVCRERFPHQPKPAAIESRACNSKPDSSRAQKLWSEVITSTRFRFMTEHQRERARMAFFDEHISPLASESTPLSALQREWDKQTYPARYVSCR